jgi:glycosyltransferase involved in cell wall biosynthesis
MRVAVTMLQCWHRTPGGTARSAIGQSDALARIDGMEVIGVGPWGWRGWGRDPDPQFEPTIPIRHLPAPHQVLYETWHRWRQPAVQLVTGPVDLVHATNLTVPPRRRGVPLVVTVHDLFPFQYPDQFTDRGRKMLTRGAEIARAEADLVLCPSEATAGDCEAYGIERSRLRVVQWGTDLTPATAEAEADVRRRYQLDGPFALWVGTVEPRKNLGVLLRALRDVPPEAGPLVIVGPDGWMVDLDALLEPVRDRVRRLGYVPTADLPALNAAASVSVLPSTAEGFGFTALEAMAQGTPTVESSGSASEEVVGPAGVILPSEDADAWAETLTELLTGPERAARLGAQGQDRAQGFSWARCAEGTASAYGEVVGTDGPAR